MTQTARVVVLLWTPEPPELIDGKGPMKRASERRPKDFRSLDAQAQWDVDKALGILDWDGNPEK